jgi:endo-1,4-beta-xylanase
MIGAALNDSQCAGHNEVESAIIEKQFNTITPENVMKWEVIHPRPGVYHFGPADRYVALGQKDGMFIIGHNLVWHAQTPRWVFEDEQGKPVTRSVLLQRMHDHIFAVVGRYKGRIKGWDVVNEALADDGSLRASPWEKIIGDDYIEQAFRFAHEADPDAELYYNDFSLENGPKLKGAIALVKRLQAAGVLITGVGTQTHIKINWPAVADEEHTITELGKLGIKVMVTEMDIDVLPAATANHGADVSLHIAENPALNPYPQELPAAKQEELAQRYADLFAMYLKHSDVLERVTFWGVTDGDSWLNDWPVHGRTSYPLLFDRAGKPKLAFDKVIATVQVEKDQGKAAANF